MPVITQMQKVSFQSVLAMPDRVDLFLSQVIAWNAQTHVAVKYHSTSAHYSGRATEKKPRFVIQDAQGRDLCSFHANEQDVPVIATRRYAAWCKRQAKQQQH